MSVDGEFKRLTAKDRLCAVVLKAVRENDTAALRRLGLGGFAQYAGRLSELMTASVRGGLDYSPDFAALMRQVNSPVRYAHHLVNECGTAVQTALDEQNGLRLRVVQPEYNDGRTKAIVGEAAESDSEHAADNLATQLGTEVKDAGNEFMRQNAEQRSRAGFKVTVERTGGANCCPWCADRIGRWELKDAPKDVFGVHDKCTCMVTYTDGRGVSTQAKAAAGKWLWHPIEQNTPPLHVLTDGEKRGTGEPKRLTGGANGGIMLPDIIIGRSVGAKAKNYDIMDLATGEIFHLVEGSRLQNVQVFAGKGSHKPYEKAWKYANKHGGKVEDWQHVKGFGLVDYYGEEREAELHWSQCEGIGKYDFFIKRWLDES